MKIDQTITEISLLENPKNDTEMPRCMYTGTWGVCRRYAGYGRTSFSEATFVNFSYICLKVDTYHISLETSINGQYNAHIYIFVAIKFLEILRIQMFVKRKKETLPAR